MHLPSPETEYLARAEVKQHLAVLDGDGVRAHSARNCSSILARRSAEIVDGLHDVLCEISAKLHPALQPRAHHLCDNQGSSLNWPGGGDCSFAGSPDIQ